jgi:hypothetical protein
MRKTLFEKKKQAIMNTRVCAWDEDGYWVVSSPLAMDQTLGTEVIGAEVDKEVAYRIFEELLDAALEDYYAGRLAFQPKRGKPAKHKMLMSAQVSPQVLGLFKKEASTMKISQGEFVEFLFAHYKAHVPKGLK